MNNAKWGFIPAANVVRFFQEVKGELSRVVWPTIPSFLESTVVVLVLIVFFAIYLGVVDMGLTHLVQYIITNYK